MPPTLGLVLLHLLCAEFSVAKSVNLFASGRYARNYDRVVSQIARGQDLKFSDGIPYRVQGVLNLGALGATTAVIELEGDRVLRFPLTREAGEFAIKQYLDGHRKLKNTPIPIPKITFVSPQLEYLVVEKIPVRFTLDELLTRIPFKPRGVSTLPIFLPSRMDLAACRTPCARRFRIAFAQPARLEVCPPRTQLVFAMLSDGRLAPELRVRAVCQTIKVRIHAIASADKPRPAPPGGLKRVVG